MRAAEAPPDLLEVGSRARRRRARSDEQLCGLVVTRAIGFSCFEAVLRLPGVLAGGVSRPKQLRGLQVAQARKPAPAISPEREWRAIEQRRAARVPHDLHALSWVIAFHRAVGKLATDNWRTPSYVTGRYPVPQVGSGHRRHPISINEIPLPDGQAIIDIELTTSGEVKPDVSLEVKIETLKLTFDLLVELDLTERPSYNREKLLAYDAFLCGWCLEHPRYKTLGTRPVVLFVCRDERSLLGCAKAAG